MSMSKMRGEMYDYKMSDKSYDSGKPFVSGGILSRSRADPRCGNGYAVT